MAEFLAMGGYGVYVWTAYGATIVVLGALLWQSWRLARKKTAELAALRDARPARPDGAARRIAARRVEPPVAGAAG